MRLVPVLILIGIVITASLVAGCTSSSNSGTPVATTTQRTTVPTSIKTTVTISPRTTSPTTSSQIDPIIGRYQAISNPSQKLEFRENGVLTIEGYDKYNLATWQKGDIDIDPSNIKDTKIIPGDGYVIKAHDTTCKPDQSPYLYRTGYSTVGQLTFSNYEDCTIMQYAGISGKKLTLFFIDWEKI